MVKTLFKSTGCLDVRGGIETCCLSYSPQTGRTPCRRERTRWCNRDTLQHTTTTQSSDDTQRVVIRCRWWFLALLASTAASGDSITVDWSIKRDWKGFLSFPEVERLTQVFHQRQREDDAHRDDDDEVVSIHEPVTRCRRQQTYVQ